MDNTSGSHELNIDAESFEPKITNGNEPEEIFKQSGNSGNIAGATSSYKSPDSDFMSPIYCNDLFAQFSNMALSQQYMYMHTIPGGISPNPSFQNSLLTNRLPGTLKSTPTGQNALTQYMNPYISCNRINQSPIIPFNYLIQQPVPNLTNAAVRSRRNSCMVNKVFNTGDPQIDQHLTESYKMINPRSAFNRDMNHSRFFVIKSYTEDHVHRSIKYGEWCSTQRGNDILDKAYRSVQSQGGHVFLFFSVNSSGYFCGVAQMTSEFDLGRRSSHWNDDKWQGGFQVEWLYVKDVPNKYLKHIILEYNDNRPITNSRDATEIKPAPKGYETLRLIHEYHHNSSLFDDFEFYEQKEKESLTNMMTVPHHVPQ